ncbi:hypothetical protein JCM3774_006550 [Rhodotorula dairenensis]
MASETDYDSLPSPPQRARARGPGRTATSTRRYGKRATRAAPASAAGPSQPNAAASAPPARKRRLDSSDTTADDELSTPSPKSKTRRPARTKAAGTKRNRVATQEKERVLEDAEADVESADDDLAGSGKEKRSAGSSTPKTAPEVSDEEQRRPRGKDRLSAAAGSGTGTKSIGSSSAGRDRNGRTEDRSKAASRPTTDTATGRKTGALADKSNLAVQRERRASPAKLSARTHATSAPTRNAPKPAKSAVPTGSSARRASTLQVYRDSSAKDPDGAVPSETATVHRPLLPVTDLPARRPRPPRRLLARHASEPLADPPPRPHGTGSVSYALPRSPTSGQHSLGGGARASRAQQQFLVPPSQGSDAPAIPRPAPWALSAPASPVLHHSSSPIGPAADGLPAFQFTTTEFGDLPSLQLEREVGGVAGGTEGSLFPRIEGEGVGEGMDSTVVLETWDESAANQSMLPPQASPSPTVQTSRFVAEHEDDTTIRAQRVDEVDEQTGTADGDVTVRLEPPGDGEVQEGLAAGGDQAERDVPCTCDATVSPVAQTEANADAEEVLDEQGKLGETVTEQPQPSADGHKSARGPATPTSQVKTPRDDRVRSPPKRKSTGPVHYTSSFLPPRHPRWPTDEPLPSGPPSSEDELAYYLRTTGTFSSEDDLAASDEAPSDESAKEDWLAEREVGRAVKASSRQREKRLGAYSEAKSTAARLQLGDGAGGRRKEWKREILPLEHVRLPRLMREAIEAKALQLGQELEELDVEDDRAGAGTSMCAQSADE